MWDVGAVNHSLATLSPFFLFVLFPPSGQRASDCELGEWSQWSSCMKKNKTCGFKKGSQSRLRSQLSTSDTSLSFVPSQACAPQTERRKCVVTRIPCSKGKHTAHSGHLKRTTLTDLVVFLDTLVRVSGSYYNNPASPREFYLYYHAYLCTDSPFTLLLDHYAVVLNEHQGATVVEAVQLWWNGIIRQFFLPALLLFLFDLYSTNVSVL